VSTELQTDNLDTHKNSHFGRTGLATQVRYQSNRILESEQGSFSNLLPSGFAISLIDRFESKGRTYASFSSLMYIDWLIGGQRDPAFAYLKSNIE
jgi:hypothetical protein